MSTKKICRHGNCDKPHNSRGLCRSHYIQWTRLGEELPPARRTDTPTCKSEGCTTRLSMYNTDASNTCRSCQPVKMLTVAQALL